MKNLSDASHEQEKNLRNYRCKQIDLVEFSRRNREIEKFIVEYDNTRKRERTHVDHYTLSRGLIRCWIPCWERADWLLKYSKEEMKRLLSKVFKKKKRVVGLYKNQISISDDFDEPLYLDKEEELTKEEDLTKEALTLRKNLFKELEAEIKDMKNWKENKK